MNMQDLRKRIKGLVASPGPVFYPHLTAASMLEELEPKDVRDLARRYLEDLINEALRDKARRVENRASSWSSPPPPPASSETGSAASSKTPKHQSYPWNEKGRRACRSCGCDACKAALSEYWKVEEDSNRKLLSSLAKITKDYANAIRLEITAELLASSFALGDGRQVTWADATIEDHEARIKLLQTNAFKNIETASKHQAAISMLEEARALTLGSLALAS